MQDQKASPFLRASLWIPVLGVALAVAGGNWTGASSDASELRRTAVVRAVQKAAPSVVNIHGEKLLTPGDEGFGKQGADHRVNGMGTGVVVDERGYIMTNHHVVDGVEKIQVTLSTGESFVAEIVSHDPSTDLAIIKIDAPRELPIITLGSSHDLMPGEPVVAVGNAFGYEHTVTVGIISALNRTVQVGETQKYENLIQTDASINPGNSGGPLLNIDGQLIGINVAVRVGAQGIGFAIPVNKALKVATDLMSTRRIDRTWHGLVAETQIIGDNAQVVVGKLDRESPASSAGLQAGDVIQSVAGTTVAHTYDVERALLGHEAGEEVDVTVRRANESTQVRLTIKSLPDRLQVADDPTWDIIGLRLKPIPERQFQRFRSRYRGGLAVVAVRPDSPASQQGIRRGDVLVGMHIWETISLDNVSYILNRPDFANLDPLKFYILRGNETLYGNLVVSGRR